MGHKLLTSHRQRFRWQGPILITAIYFVFGSLWILVSDNFVYAVAPSPEALLHLQTYKGTAYVFITTGLIFSLLNIYAQRATGALETLKTKQQELSDILEQRDELIRELYHRVRNNLQVVIAIIRLSAPNASPERHLRRIETLAMIQDEIYENAHVTAIELGPILGNVVRFLAPLAERSGVKINQNYESCVVSIDMVVSIGLAVSVLVERGIIAGRTSQRERFVEVRLHCDKRDVFIVIRHSLPGETDHSPIDGTDLEIAKALTGQVGGTLTISGPVDRVAVQNNTAVTDTSIAFQIGE